MYYKVKNVVQNGRKMYYKVENVVQKQAKMYYKMVNVVQNCGDENVLQISKNVLQSGKCSTKSRVFG